MKLQQIDNTYLVKGDITFKTVMSLWKIGANFIQNNSQYCVFDLSQIKQCDSAGVALLVNWAKQANQAKKEVSFVNLSEKLTRMLKAYGLIHILMIE